MKFYQLVTNRVKAKKTLSLFKHQLLSGEKVISPRPLPGKNSSQYIVFFTLNEESESYSLFLKNYSNSNIKELSEVDYTALVGTYKHFWE